MEKRTIGPRREKICLWDFQPSTVDSELFSRILFSGIAFKDIFATLKNRDKGMLYQYHRLSKVC